jgi:hypothetical protein
MPPKLLNHLSGVITRGLRRPATQDAPGLVAGQVESASTPAPEHDRFLVLESCHSTWLFDEEDHRFCRVLKGDLAHAVSTEWREYDRLVLHPDSEAFVVFLDASGTRLLRSWRHTSHCERCGGEMTTEMSLADLRRLVNA